MDELKGERNSSALYLAGELLVLDSYEAIDHPHIIVNGLQLKSVKEQQSFKCFSYAPSPFTKEPVDVEKMIWHRAYPIQSEHIRCHVLVPDDDIPQLIAQYHREHARAVILINNADNYTLASPSLHGDAPQADIPVIVVTSQDGETLMSTLNEYNHPGEVIAQIVSKHSESSTGKTSTLDRAKARKASSKRQLIRGASAPKDLFDPWREFKNCAFSAQGPVCICRDTQQFQYVMSAFNHYECEAKSLPDLQGKRSELLLKKFLKKLEKHKSNSAVFDENFPFYVILAVRMHRKREVYQCGDLEKFIDTVSEKVELLLAKTIADVLQGFLNQGDFKFMDGDDSTSAVQKLCDACVEILLKMSRKHRKDLYFRILWISIAIRCMQFDSTLRFDAMPKEAEKLWTNYILNDNSSITLTKEATSEIRKGLKLGDLLLLPVENQLNASRLSYLLFPWDKLRPLQHVGYFIQELMKFFCDEKQFVSSFLESPREHCYGRLLFPSNTSTLNTKQLADASVSHTVKGFVAEGVEFLDAICLVSQKKRWTSNALKVECRKWFSLLLDTVEIKEGVEKILAHLLTSGKAVTLNKDYRLHIEGEIIMKVRKRFGKLKISVFYPLYKEFYIWNNEFLSDYLRSYTTSHAELSDERWTMLFKEVVRRFPEPTSHSFILEFLKCRAPHNTKADRQVGYILDLMKLDVPDLFCYQQSGTSVPGESFKKHLQTYIATSGLPLRKELLRRVDAIMDRIYDTPHGFQDLILTVLQKDITPCLQTAELEKPALKLLTTIITVLSKNVYPNVSLTRKERFCWGVVATFCDQIQPRHNRVQWAELHANVIEKMGEIYGLYCQRQNFKRDSEQCILQEELNLKVHKWPPEVRKYYEWIQQIHAIFSNWHDKLMHQTINHDGMIDYTSNHSSISKVAKAVCAMSKVVENDYIARMKKTYLTDFEELNLLLLKYVPEIPRAKWRVLTSVLDLYGIHLPKDLQKHIEQFIVLPGESASSSLQKHPMPPSTAGIFQPPQPISLILSEGFTFKLLAECVRDLKEFLAPIKGNMDMLIFFTLHDSMLFSAYLNHELEDGNVKDMNAFRQALVKVNLLLVKLGHGEVKYIEMTANGAIDLETLDIDKEFDILLKSEQYGKLPGIKNTQGLPNVRCMVNLSKVSSRIRVVRCVCEQYQLEKCLEDEDLQKLVLLSDELMSGEARASLTPQIAAEKMDAVRSLIDIKGRATADNYEYLDIFSKIADSAEFYHFICEKGFTGEDGQARFNQQYQLITAQLQHEEYDEAVLNLLYAAYKLILPFTIKDQSFHSLLESVKQMLTTASPVDIEKANTDYLMQIETVNRNINLIKLWFSRAEGDTLQNVANDLESIFQTGHYSFIIPENIAEPGRVELTYKPSSKRAVLVSTEVPSEEQTSTVPNLDDNVKEETWDSEQTGNFARKLGFLDSEKAGGELVKPFLQINEIANRIMEVLLKLRELGYPLNLAEAVKSGLKCNNKEADRMVRLMEHTLNEWSQKLEKLLLKHDWLLLLNIPKLRKFSKLLRRSFRPDFDAEEIMEEIGFLFCSTVQAREKVTVAIKDSLNTLRSELFNLESTNEASVPLKICGMFLDALFKHSEIVDISPQKYNNAHCLIHSTLCRPKLHSSDSMEVLHSAPNFTEGELISIIVNIYQGRLPQSYEFFRCHENSTAHQLKLFLTRAINHPLSFVILGVNNLPINLQEMLLKQHMDFHSSSDYHETQPCIHYVQTLPSVLQEMPWIQHEKHKCSDVMKSAKEVHKICHQQAIIGRGLKCVKLVYGTAGVGKSHHIRQQLLKSSISVTIAVNEGFEPLKAIERLHILPKDQPNCAIYFNFNLIPPVGDSVHKRDKRSYDNLMETVSWFFFDLLFLGYVEDSHSGESFQLPGGLSWSIYIEVPARSLSSNPNDFLEDFLSEIPILRTLSTAELVESTAQYSVKSNPDVQLVCKYLKAYETGGEKGIDRLFKEGKKRSNPIKFSTMPELPSEECERLLVKYVPASIRNTKTSQQLFLKYMKRRCWFLDNLPSYNFNTGAGIRMESGDVTDTRHLGSTLMAAMIREAEQVCHPCFDDNRGYHQLIYDVQDGGGSIGLLSTAPHKLPHLKDIVVEIPTMVDIHKREFLDKCLSRALNIPLKDGRLTAIDNENYVLTLDFTIKMLQIHERYECGEPVIIQGETGVGKTALIQMLSKLWNVSLDVELKRLKGRLLEFLRQKLRHGSTRSVTDLHRAWLQVVDSMITGEKKSVEEDDLMSIAMLRSASSSGHVYQEMREYLNDTVGDPLLPLLDISCQEQKPLEILFKEAIADPPVLAGAKPVVKVFHALLTASVKSTFHKLNVHAAMKPADLCKHLESAFEQAHQLLKANEGVSTPFLRVPNVTIFLDELNASTCGGLFKEIIIDRTFEGEPIPENVFIIAACNPHRGNSLAALSTANKTGKSRVGNSDETWIMDSYYVRELHPTLEHLMWDYGSLGEDQERQYVLAKVVMLSNQLSEIQQSILTEVIVCSQNLMRQYAFEELSNKLTEGEAKISSKCCVSQRDIQRVFTFYEWSLKLYRTFKPHKDSSDYTTSLRAILVALGIVYYMRLNRTYRTRYQIELSQKHKIAELQFSEVFESELEWYSQQIELPTGIAKTQALKENLFAVVICTVTQTPLIIVGSPGSSKTLSFNIAVSNLKGQESKKVIFRNTDVFCSLDPHFYQCSRRTTSNEVRTVFSRAITRQKNNAQFSLPIKCVVFMDEAGLPEQSHESLKILHYHLDKPEVSFVAISNTVLDAAKTNRAITLFRDPTEMSEDLEVLATECLFESPGCPPHNLKEHVSAIVGLHNAYTHTVTEMKLSKFFGLRDFIHFVHFIRRKYVQRDTSLSLYQSLPQVGQLVVESLERNFSGSQHFSEICEVFLRWMNLSPADVRRRDAVQVLKDSLNDTPTTEDEVRYKIIIHSSEDDSLVRVLFQHKLLERQNTRIYMCSDFPGDTELQKIDTIAGIRHSAIQGHSIVMLQTDDIHESFYDLFNRRFQRIDDPNSGTRLYANIAIGAHLKPCRVHPKFQCIVAIKKSELDQAPAPFLNRFEKYYIAHKDILEFVLRSLPTGIISVVKAAINKVQQFIQCVDGSSSIYGFCEETLDSLLLTVLPVGSEPPLATGITLPPQQLTSMVNFENEEEKQTYILQVLTEALRQNFKFHFQQCPAEEMKHDAECLFRLVLSSNPNFEGAMKTEVKDMKAAKAAIHSALDALQQGHINFTEELSPSTQLMWSLLVQWLVRHCCKQLTQLMTPEALVLHEEQIPASYIQHYLSYQKHFSLKDLIQQQFDKVSLIENRSNTKVLCFTRTSPLIHSLPSMYPSPVHLVTEQADHEKTLSSQIFNHVPGLVVCKLEGARSQQSVKEMLKEFTESEKQVILLLANMQEVSKSAINHLRVMIEEEEATSEKTSKPKLFLILLHFPPAMFFTACYPSLFLEGWDHYYLDTIVHGLSHGIIDSVEWLHMSCFPTEQAISVIEDSFFIMLKHLLRQSVPHVVSRLSFGSDYSRRFNRPMNPLARSRILYKLFTSDIGDALCHHFRSYWKAEVMTEYLHRAVKFTQTGQTTLNITDSIHSIMKSYFLDFVVYMVDYMNDNYNLDIFFSSNSNEVKKLFSDLTRCLPIPQKLSKLKILSRIQQESKYRKTVIGRYQFPFFQVVCPQIVDIIKEVALHLRQSGDSQDLDVPVLQDQRAGDQLVFEFEKQLQRQVEERLLQMKGQQGCIAAVAISAIDKHKELWDRYFHDFTREKLSLWLHKRQIVEETLEAAFGTVCSPSASNMSQLTSLHVYTYLNQQSISTNVAALGSLMRLSSVSEDLSGRLRSMSSSSQLLLKTEDTNTFVLNTLFNTLLTASGQQASVADLKLWYSAYHAMISSPTIRKRVYSSLSASSEAKLNIMHAAFLVVQYDPSDNGLLMKCQDMVNGLCSGHFTIPSFELIEDCPQMPEISIAVIQVLCEPQGTDVFESNRPVVTFITEGLLTHFFCYYDTPDSRNISWLLQYINEQEHLLDVQLPQHSAAVHLSLSSRSSSYDSEEVDLPIPSTSSDTDCVPLTMLKYFLLRILGSCSAVKEEGRKQWIPPFETEGRAIVGTFLAQNVSSDVTGTYVPPFYQLSGVAVAENDLQSQPLAYLYFLTVLEHLFHQHNDLSSLLNVALEVYENGPKERSEQILICIEKQALVQTIIKEFAKHLVPEKYIFVTSKLANLQKALNRLLDEHTSGGRIEVHGHILAMHLLIEIQSLEKFTRLITEEYDTHCTDYKCLGGFRGMFKEPYISRAHFFHLFSQEDQSSPLRRLQQQVHKLVMEVAEGKAKPNRLIKLAKESQRSQMSLPSSDSPEWMEKLPCLKVMIWLTVYQDIYNKKVQSTELTDACNKLPPDLFGMPFCQLIRWFASPMDRAKPGLLSKLFSPSNPDPTDISLRHSLANLVACALGTHERTKSSHLWTLTFAPETLKGTYLAGCMNAGTVSVEEGRPYESGVQLTSDGMRDLLLHSTWRNLSLNSHCMLLWINVASFCVSLLTREGDRLRGIFSSTVQLEEYCVSQLRHIWKLMRSNMQLTDEELSYLVMMCMRRKLQIWLNSPESVTGTITEPGKIVEYEEQWHTDIFVPCLKKLGKEFFKSLQYPLRKLIVEIRHLETCYPHFPADSAALYSLLSLPDVHVKSQEKVAVLSKFIYKMPEIQTILPFLPDFMEFYQWLHRDLAGFLTPEQADKISIKKLVDRMSRHNGESGSKLMSLYKRVKDGYNEYLKVAVGIPSIAEFDSIRVRRFLTLNANAPTEYSEDILYGLIYEMVTCHNSLLDSIEIVESHSREAHMSRYIQENIPSVAPFEVTENTCLVGRSEVEQVPNELLQLVSRRHNISTATQNMNDLTVMRPHLLTLNGMLKLQEDIVSRYLTGRPRIANISSIHIPFVFRASKPTSEAHPLNFAQDLNQVGKLLPPSLKSDFTDDHSVLQLLECEFHSADYHTILDVVTGLKTAVALLEKKVKKTGSDGTELQEIALETFLCTEEDKAHQELEIFGKRLSGHQLLTMMHLRVSNIYHTFTIFVQWAVEGRYGFHMLPYALKAHLNPEDVEQLKKIRSLYKNGSEPIELLAEFKLLAEVLDLLESNLMVIGPQVPLVDYLNTMFVFEGHDEFLGLIPQTILIQHYVSLRLLLKQLTMEVQKDSPRQEGEIKKPWREIVPSFSGNTAEIYEALGNFEAEYGFKHGYQSDTDSFKIETESTTTQFELLHEDDIDDMGSMQPSDFESLKDKGLMSPLLPDHGRLPVQEMSTGTLQQVHPSPSSTEKRTVEMAIQIPALDIHVLDKKQMLQRARQYNSKAVANFVTSIGYSDYAEQFDEMGFSGDALLECTDEDLKDLEIESALARLKIVILFKRQLQGLNALAKNVPTERVVEFLDGLRPQEKEQYKQSFGDNEIDGEMLLAMEGKDDVMIELGVQRPAHRRIIWSKFKTFLEELGHSTASN